MGEVGTEDMIRTVSAVLGAACNLPADTFLRKLEFKVFVWGTDYGVKKIFILGFFSKDLSSYLTVLVSQG